jgi:hypothetical protein
MANEAVLVQQLEDHLMEVTVADGAGLEKGTVLKWADPNTGSASSADGDIFCGILATEKTASDGQTRMAVHRRGVFDMKVDGTGATMGQPVKINGANLVGIADDDTIENKGQVIGVAMQTGAADEVIEVLVGGI